MFKIGRLKSRRWNNFRSRWPRGLRGLENWTIFMDVICVSSLASYVVLDYEFEKVILSILNLHVLVQ